MRREIVEKFWVSGSFPEIRLLHRPLDDGAFAYINDGHKITPLTHEKTKCGIRLWYDFPDDRQISVSYTYEENTAFEARCDIYELLAKNQINNMSGKSGRCPYCNCKLDPTKTHCASCGAPC